MSYTFLIFLANFFLLFIHSSQIPQYPLDTGTLVNFLFRFIKLVIL